MTSPWPPLFRRDKAGAVLAWKVRVEVRGALAFTVAEEGAVGQPVRTTRERIAGEGPRAVERAHAEADGRWQRQLQQGWSESAEGLASSFTGGIAVMLAREYAKYSQHIRFPAFAQPKVDGFRCAAMIKDGRCTLWSRERQQITSMPHVVEALEAAYPKGEHLVDGELYAHEFRHRFDALSKLISPAKPVAGHERVHFYAFDLAAQPGSRWAGVPFSARYDALRAQLVAAPLPLVLVETVLVLNEAGLLSAKARWIVEGYEGAMVRNASGLYVGERSDDLQKLKQADDHEFIVTGVKEGTGSMKGHAIFVCRTPADPSDLPGAIDPLMPGDVEFTVDKVGPLAALKEVWRNPAPYIGRWLTVRYEGFSAKGAPRFARALRFREPS